MVYIYEQASWLNFKHDICRLMGSLSEKVRPLITDNVYCTYSPWEKQEHLSK